MEEEKDEDIIVENREFEDEFSDITDSELTSAEDEDPFEGDLDKEEKKKTSKFLKYFYDSFLNQHYKALIVDLILIIFLVGLWNKEVHVKNPSGEITVEKLRYFICYLILLTTLFILSSFCFHNISLVWMRTYKRLSFVFYCINELSANFSFGILNISCILIVLIKKKNVCFANNQNFEVYIGDILIITLLCDILLAILKILSKSLSMNFNYTVYMDRIKKCVFFEVLLNMVVIMKEKSRDEEGFVNKNPTAILKDFFHEDAAKSKFEYLEYILDTFCDDDNEGVMDIPKKRLLLREFQKIFKKSRDYKGNVIKYMNKFRSKSVHKVRKIFSILVKKPRVRKVGDLKVYFNNVERFNIFIKTLELKQEIPLDQFKLRQLIETHYKERLVLKENLDQINSAIDRVSLVFCGIIVVLGFLLLYIRIANEFATTAGVVSAIFGTQFLSNSFSSNAINALIFLFIIHPYDIGDRVFIDIDHKVENLVVSELNVFSTVFYRFDGTCVYIPNSILSAKLIANVRRSGIMAESHKIQINSRTNQKKLNKLKECIENFVKTNPDKYTEYIMVNYESIENTNKLHMKIYMQYRGNWQNYERYLERKTFFLSFLNRTLQGLDIEYVLPPQRVVLRRKKDNSSCS